MEIILNYLSRLRLAKILENELHKRNMNATDSDYLESLLASRIDRLCRVLGKTPEEIICYMGEQGIIEMVNSWELAVSHHVKFKNISALVAEPTQIPVALVSSNVVVNLRAGQDRP